MTDKVQKIKEYLVGMAGAACCDSKTKKVIKANILPFIDSLQEEPKDRCKGCNNVKGCVTCVDGSEWAHYEEAKIPPAFDEGYWERLGEEPVSEDLEDFALQYAGHHAPYDDCMQEVVDAVKAGAQWQKAKDKEKWMEEALDFLGSNYNSLIDGGVIGVFDDKKKMIEEFVEFMKDDNL